MIEPKDPISQILSQYPDVRKIYESRHSIEDDSIDTETFCEKYNIAFFDLWMQISREASKTESAKYDAEQIRQKEEKERIEKERKRQESRLRGINFKTMNKDQKIYVLVSFSLLIVAGLNFLAAFLLKSLTPFFISVVLMIVAIVMIVKYILKKAPGQYRQIRLKNLSKEDRLKASFAFVMLFGGAILFFVAKFCQWGHGLEAIGMGLAVTGSSIVSLLSRVDEKKGK